MKLFYSQLVNLGITPDIEFSRARKVRLINQISLIIAVSNLLLMTRWFILDRYIYSLMNVTAILCMILVLYLNYRLLYRLASTIFFLVIPLLLISISVFLPLGVQQYLFPMMIIAGLLIEKRRNLLIYLIFIGLTYLFIEGEFITYYVVELSDAYQAGFKLLSSFLSLVFCFVAINMFVKLYEMKRHETLIVNDMLEESVRMAKEKADYAQLMLREMNHRVKNNLQLVSSLLNINASKTESKKARKALLDAKHRVHSIALVHEKLYHCNNMESIDIAEFLSGLIKSIRQAAPNNDRETLKINSNCDHFNLKVTDAVSVGLIINEMITNALLHGLKDLDKKDIQVNVQKLGESHLHLTVRDNGNGIEQILDPGRQGFGMELIETLANNYQGKLSVHKKANQVTLDLYFNGN